MSEWKIRTRYEIGSDGYALVILRRNYDDTVSYIAPLEVRTVKAFAAIPDDELTISDVGVRVEDGLTLGAMDFLQAAMNAAWDLGMRPVGFGDTSLQVKALIEHRDDLRKIAFHKLGVPQS